jgi:hypothetical protein
MKMQYLDRTSLQRNGAAAARSLRLTNRGSVDNRQDRQAVGSGVSGLVVMPIGD